MTVHKRRKAIIFALLDIKKLQKLRSHKRNARVGKFLIKTDLVLTTTDKIFLIKGKKN